VAEQVKRIGIWLAGLGRDRLEIDAALGQLLDDCGALLRVGPASTEVFRAGAEAADLFGRVVGELDDAKLFAVGVQLVDQFGGDFDLAAIKIVLTG
jgi:hypothetical protein